MSDPFELPKYIERLIASINDGARSAQAGALAFTAVGLYLLATAFATTDEDLLLERTTTVAQIGVQIPLVFSFAIAPAVFVAIHVFTLIRYDLLATNLRQFRTELDSMVAVEADRERCRHLLANVEFVQALTAPPGSPLRSSLFAPVSVFLTTIFPVLVLLAVQISSLRYQSDRVLLTQRLALLADLAVLVWFFLRRHPRGIAMDRPSALGAKRLGRALALPGIIIVLNLLYLGVASPDANTVRKGEDYDCKEWFTQSDLRSPPGKLIVDATLHTLQQQQPLDLLLCPWLGWGCRYLQVDHRTLVGRVWNEIAVADLRTDRTGNAESLKSLEGVFLRDRQLRFAKLDESLLFAADLRNADLRHATLKNASLRGADLTGAQLEGADLNRANLMTSRLTDAKLQGACLSGSQLQDADLRGADLQNADLANASLARADLHKSGGRRSGAMLQRANLVGARLRAADMRGAQLKGAKLKGRRPAGCRSTWGGAGGR